MAFLKCHRAVQHENLTFVSSLFGVAVWKRFQARGSYGFRLLSATACDYLQL